MSRVQLVLDLPTSSATWLRFHGLAGDGPAEARFTLTPEQWSRLAIQAEILGYETISEEIEAAMETCWDTLAIPFDR